MVRPSTFSIVACDLKAEEWGVIVQSKFLAVGPIVPWAEPHVGAVATQAYANPSYGPRGLELMRAGLDAEAALAKLVEEDPEREHRQVGLVDAQGRAAAFTGRECYEWAGHLVGEGYACQGNILAGEAVVRGLARAFEESEGPLAERLIAALQAGQQAGGDRRGQQSAAILVVKAEAGYGGISDRFVDLRVDDHAQPVEELQRLYRLHRLFFGQTTETIELGKSEITSIQRMLGALGYLQGRVTGELDEATLNALEDFHHMENLEMRTIDDPGKLDADVLRFMEERYRQARHEDGKPPS